MLQRRSSPCCLGIGCCVLKTTRMVLLLLLATTLSNVGGVSAAAWLGGVASSSIRNSNTKSKIPPPSNVKILILPGFGNDAADYYLNQAQQGSLVRSLQLRGWEDVRVLPMQRTDWLQVFWRGGFDAQFWRGVAPPTRPAFRWYLDRVAAAIQDMTNEDDDNDNTSQVLLVAHSAGGWLARAALGYYSAASDDDDTTTKTTRTSMTIDLSKICGLVTLGAPHQPPPPTEMDMTRGALKRTHRDFPGAYHQQAGGLFYVTVIGQAIRGVPQQPRQKTTTNTTTEVEGFAYRSYQAVCGDGNVTGDGVVPVVAAHLEDAKHQLTLPNVWHSINRPDQWYGSDAVLDQWHDAVLDELAVAASSAARRRTTNSNPLLESLFKMNR